jgi:hypothetical protein
LIRDHHAVVIRLVNQIPAHVKGKSFRLPARQRMPDPTTKRVY